MKKLIKCTVFKIKGAIWLWLSFSLDDTILSKQNQICTLQDKKVQASKQSDWNTLFKRILRPTPFPGDAGHNLLVSTGKRSNRPRRDTNLRPIDRRHQLSPPSYCYRLKRNVQDLLVVLERPIYVMGVFGVPFWGWVECWFQSCWLTEWMLWNVVLFLLDIGMESEVMIWRLCYIVPAIVQMANEQYKISHIWICD